MRVDDETGPPGSADLADAERDPREPDVLGLLLENHERFLTFVERRIGSRADAEDILQEAFVRSLEHTPRLQSSTSATSWFYRVLRNAMTDYFRRKDTRGRALDQLAAETDQAGTTDDELERVVCACVMSLLDTLKPEYATALRRVDLEGVTVRDYSAEAGITQGNGAVRLHRARETLRRQLARCCGTCLEHGCLDCQCSN